MTVLGPNIRNHYNNLLSKVYEYTFSCSLKFKISQFSLTWHLSTAFSGMKSLTSGACQYWIAQTQHCDMAMLRDVNNS